MKINLIEVETPSSSSFTMFAEPDYDLLRETKTVKVRIGHETKTRLSTSIQFGSYRVGVNFQSEGFKTFEKTEHSYFTGNYTTSHYFVKSKKQDLESYKEYVKAVVENAVKNYLHVELDELIIELEPKHF